MTDPGMERCARCGHLVKIHTGGADGKHCTIVQAATRFTGTTPPPLCLCPEPVDTLPPPPQRGHCEGLTSLMSYRAAGEHPVLGAGMPEINSGLDRCIAQHLLTCPLCAENNHWKSPWPSYAEQRSLDAGKKELDRP